MKEIIVNLWGTYTRGNIFDSISIRRMLYYIDETKEYNTFYRIDIDTTIQRDIPLCFNKKLYTKRLNVVDEYIVQKKRGYFPLL